MFQVLIAITQQSQAQTQTQATQAPRKIGPSASAAFPVPALGAYLNQLDFRNVFSQTLFYDMLGHTRSSQTSVSTELQAAGRMTARTPTSLLLTLLLFVPVLVQNYLNAHTGRLESRMVRRNVFSENLMVAARHWRAGLQVQKGVRRQQCLKRFRPTKAESF